MAPWSWSPDPEAPMSFIPPTVANLQDEVAGYIGVILQDVGLFRLVVPVYSSIGDTPVILQGLRKGLKAVGVTPPTI